MNRRTVSRGHRTRGNAVSRPNAGGIRAGAEALPGTRKRGTITLDVAEIVKPGNVIGIDPMKDRIQVATQLVEQRRLVNVAFEVGDTYNLRFPEDTFDIAYGHTVLHSLIDPVKALRAQKRVTKSGG